MKRFAGPIHFILYGNVWIALGAAAATMQTLCVLGVDRPSAVWFTGIATFFTYNFQRLVKLDRLDGYADHNRNAWSVRWRRVMTVLTALSFGILLTFIPLLSTRVLVLLILAFAIAVGYVVRIVPTRANKRMRRRALRELPYTKLLLIAGVWGASTVLVPVWWTDAELQSVALLVLIIERCLFIAALSVPFDIRDAELDDPSQRTLPHLLGLKGSRNVAVVLLIASAGCSAYLWKDGWYPVATFIALGLSQLLSAMAVYGSVKVEGKGTTPRAEPYYSGLLDGMIIVQAVLILIVG